MNEIMSASHDVVFKALFVRNPELLRAFLRDVLELPLTDEDEIKILNPDLIPDGAEEKFCRLDIYVKTENKRFNIEMQARRNGFSEERVLYYWAKMFTEGFEKGKFYEELEKSFSVNVLGFNFTGSKDYHSSYSIREDKRNEQLTDKLSIHFFELTKVPKNMIDCDEKQIWMKLFKADTKEALEMLKSTNNSAINQAVDAIYTLNADEVLREKIRQREKALCDYYNDIGIAKRDAMKEGMEKGMEKADEETRMLFREMGWTEKQIADFFAKKKNNIKNADLKLSES